MKIAGAEVVLEWSNGKRVKMGTLDITADSVAESKASMRMRWYRQRIGWDLVRMGFRIMFPWRKWKETREP